MFKKVLLFAAFVTATLFVGGQAEAQVYVRGHYRLNGSYVRPHYRSYPDQSFSNNWSTYPNINPYTGKMGTRRMPSYGGYRSYHSPSLSYWNW